MSQIITEPSPLIPRHYTKIDVTYNTSDDVFVYTLDTDVVGTVTVTYTDATKTYISNVVRT